MTVAESDNQTDEDRKWYAFWSDDTAGDLSKYEDMTSQAKRYKRRAGSQDAVRLPCERTMPKKNTPGAWEAYHQANAHRGTFDPCSILRRGA